MDSNVNILQHGRLLSMPNDAVRMKTIPIRNVFLMKNDGCSDAILKTPTSIVKYSMVNDEAPTDIMSSSAEFELLGVAGLIWVYKEGTFTAMTKDGIVVGEKLFEGLGSPAPPLRTTAAYM